MSADVRSSAHDGGRERGSEPVGGDERDAVLGVSGARALAADPASAQALQSPPMSLDDRFQEYFSALDRAGQKDRCFLCRRTPAEVKLFFGFDEDGVPLKASEFGLEDVSLDATDIMSYRGERPVCAICQLSFDAVFALGERDVLERLIDEMEKNRDYLWPREQP